MLTLRSPSQQPRRTTQSYWSDDERPSNKTAEWASLDVGGKLVPSWLRWTCVGLHDQCEFGSAISPTTTYVFCEPCQVYESHAHFTRADKYSDFDKRSKVKCSQRRQALPPEVFWDAQQLRRMHSHSFPAACRLGFGFSSTRS